MSKFQSLIGVLFTFTLFAEILIITSQQLWLDVVFKRHLDGGVEDTCAKLVSDWQGEIKKGILAFAFEATSTALDVAFRSTLEELTDGANLGLILGHALAETDVNCVEEDSAELLDVLLLKGLCICPVK